MSDDTTPAVDPVVPAPEAPCTDESCDSTEATPEVAPTEETEATPAE